VEHLVGSGNDGLVVLIGCIENKHLAAGGDATQALDVALGDDGGLGYKLRIGAVEEVAASVAEPGVGGDLGGFGGGGVAQEKDPVAQVCAMDSSPPQKGTENDQKEGIEGATGAKLAPLGASISRQA
jgi:hypothetical protein